MGERKLQRPAGASRASVGLDQTLRTAEGLLTQARFVRRRGDVHKHAVHSRQHASCIATKRSQP